MLDGVLAEYRALFADNTPVENLGQKAVGTGLQRRAARQQAVADNRVTAYRIGNTVTVSAPSGVEIPVPAPQGTRQQLLLGAGPLRHGLRGQPLGPGRPPASCGRHSP
ncbi:hypothetical protein [Streptomyces sp. NPDC047706]|uniref:hypothetical protein n=1 Tax=Streptomyces sp. NPDC047706 TaxID=3365486 RepID=UPI00371F5739